jgi:hypothetical protein
MGSLSGKLVALSEKLAVSPENNLVALTLFTDYQRDIHFQELIKCMCIIKNNLMLILQDLLV